MPREVPSLNGSQVSLIVKTLTTWAENHPYPNLPIAQSVDGSELTPANMASAAAEPTSPRGRLLFSLFAAGLIEDGVEPPETLEQILSDYWRDIDYWRAERIR